jgi:hypothetical protein
VGNFSDAHGLFIFITDNSVIFSEPSIGSMAQRCPIF